MQRGLLDRLADHICPGALAEACGDCRDRAEDCLEFFGLDDLEGAIQRTASVMASSLNYSPNTVPYETWERRRKEFETAAIAVLEMLTWPEHAERANYHAHSSHSTTGDAE